MYNCITIVNLTEITIISDPHIARTSKKPRKIGGVTQLVPTGDRSGRIQLRYASRENFTAEF
jgi:hypothetical protein